MGVFEAEIVAKIVTTTAKEIAVFRERKELYQIKDALNGMRNSLLEIGDKVATAQFKSALENIENIQMGANEYSEIICMINHLYDAYNTEQEILNEEIEFDRYVFCCKASAMICYLHTLLEQSEQAARWKQRSKKSYEAAFAIYNNSEEFQERHYRLFVNIMNKLSANPLGIQKENNAKYYYDMLKRINRYHPVPFPITREQYEAIGVLYAKKETLYIPIGKKIQLKTPFTLYCFTKEGYRRMQNILEFSKNIVLNCDNPLETGLQYFNQQLPT